MPDDTIAAVSTPPGEGAIALVRLAGPDAVAIAEAVFRGTETPSQMPSHTQRLGEIVENGDRVDQVMLAVHRAPHSYTGDDVVEISCHGGVLVTARVLDCCLRAGARAARPGEFTERAFHAGKIDLTQAEAVIDLIRAQTDLALRAASEQLEGRLGASIHALRDRLVNLIAQVEATIDFPDEDIDSQTVDGVRARLTEITETIEGLLQTAERGRILREGVRVVIFGATNAGKSSLLNRLLGFDRAIVSATPGTTRDTIEEKINLGGLPVRLLDTAGLREAADEIEREGMDRTRRSLAQADLALRIVDRNAPRPVGQTELSPEQEILVLNKSDLPEHSDWAGTEGVRLSCLTGDGFDALEQTISRRLAGGKFGEQSGVTINRRHRGCLERAGEACGRAEETLTGGLSLEYAAVDLRAALDAVGEVVGVVDHEQILDSVFGQFCIGK